jgi:uncharacterized membrane protein HdeD (DUF308 family)
MDNRAVIYQKDFHRLEHLQKQWKWFLLLGILLMLLGLVSIAYSTTVTGISIVFLGAFLLTGGIFQTVYACWAREWSGFFLSLLAGILYGVVGLLLLSHPLAGAVGLTLLLSAFYIVDGIVRIIGSLMMRFEQWGWSLFSGVVKLLLGLLILAGWPQTGLWVFGLFIGIDLLFYGWFWVLLSLSVPRLTRNMHQ